MEKAQLIEQPPIERTVQVLERELEQLKELNLRAEKKERESPLITLDRIKSMGVVSHTGLIGLVRAYVLSLGWEMAYEDLHTARQKVWAHRNYWAPVPDLTIRKPGDVRAFEIKHEPGRDDLVRGVGQCCTYTMFGFYPYLVIRDLYGENFLPIFEHIKVMGLITFTPECELKLLYGKEL